jgi:polyketide-type polyunsaturated fatty acid synthase PfaA
MTTYPRCYQNNGKDAETLMNHSKKVFVMTKNVPVAIIGMGCFFPKSLGIKQYWRLLFRGEDAVTEVPPTHWSPEDYFHENPDTPDHVYCKRGGFLPHVSFDPTEFGIPPASLEATDTSQLLGLVAAKTALENAGYPESRELDRSRVSVILGATGTQELVIPLGSRLGHPKWRKALKACGISDPKAEEIIVKISESYVPWQENSFPGLLGNVIAGRICNRLNLGGTNCAVDAACASSMSAVHLAMLELFSGKSDLVITGGVDTLNDIFMHMCFAKTRILSPSGDARPFSKNADGTVLGEGIGIIILKRLADAQKDGDRIYAVIKGIGSSSDGKSQSIYAPRAEGQIKALQAAYQQAGVDPSTVELVEAHGTGTRVGDRVEFQALSNVFKNVSKNSCALGSVKSNIGHTKAAAGAAGIIKAALALHHKVLPPTLKVDTPDPDLNIQESPFYLNTQSRPWLKNAKHPRRAGVSAFGFGGSNFHMVLEEYDDTKASPSWHGAIDIFSLSSSSRKSLEKQLLELKHHTEKSHSDENIMDAAAKSRTHFSHKDPYRLLFTINLQDSFSDQFNRVVKEFSHCGDGHFRKNREVYFGGPGSPGKLAVVFPGQGSQYLHMGRDLLCTFPKALKSLENAENIFKQINEQSSLMDYIYPKGHNTGTGSKTTRIMNCEKHISPSRLSELSVFVFITYSSSLEFFLKPYVVTALEN